MRLQQAGWELAAEEDYAYQRMRIALRHQDFQLRAMTETIDFQFAHNIHAGDLRHIVLPIQYLGSGRQVPLHESGPFNFSAVDAAAQIRLNREIRSIDDLAHFAKPLVRTQEIILPEPSIAELMAQILDKQTPARLERLREDVRAEGQIIRPRQKFHAQIISLAA